MKGIYRCISGHEVEEDRRAVDLYRWGVCPRCISPRTFNRFVREVTIMDQPGGFQILRDQLSASIERTADSRRQRLMDKMDFDATAARMDRENEALQMRNRDLNKANGDYAGRCYFYIQDAKRDAARIDRQGRVNTDLRDENVSLRATLGLRNGTIALMEGELEQTDIPHLKSEVVRLYNRCADITARLEGTIADRRKLEVQHNARKAQYDRQTNRLASAGIMIEDQRQAASVERAKHKITTDGMKAERQQHVGKMLTVNYGLRDRLKIIAGLSSPTRDADTYTDLMEVNRIATEG